ncbi:hypothetical protein niasHT_015667 [Heterodera trifolii]|uniref:Nuclear receptor domain-containing protein n=1 Tax=Heterodera trifolii TaxID=157864 RepID=A0ABD2L6I4_9BILA
MRQRGRPRRSSMPAVAHHKLQDTPYGQQQQQSPSQQYHSGEADTESGEEEESRQLSDRYSRIQLADHAWPLAGAELSATSNRHFPLSNTKNDSFDDDPSLPTTDFDYLYGHSQQQQFSTNDELEPDDSAAAQFGCGGTKRKRAFSFSSAPSASATNTMTTSTTTIMGLVNGGGGAGPSSAMVGGGGPTAAVVEKRPATKICRVCGDKAYSYNFNVITCESCKAFFRRNANKEKEIRCPFNEQCDINILSRRFCQRCRLQKCFNVGMKKEWIMSEEARLEKKQRIQENRERRAAAAAGGAMAAAEFEQFQQDSQLGDVPMSELLSQQQQLHQTDLSVPPPVLDMRPSDTVCASIADSVLPASVIAPPPALIESALSVPNPPLPLSNPFAAPATAATAPLLMGASAVGQSAGTAERQQQQQAIAAQVAAVAQVAAAAQACAVQRAVNQAAAAAVLLHHHQQQQHHQQQLEHSVDSQQTVPIDPSPLHDAIPQPINERTTPPVVVGIPGASSTTSIHTTVAESGSESSIVASGEILQPPNAFSTLLPLQINSNENVHQTLLPSAVSTTDQSVQTQGTAILAPAAAVAAALMHQHQNSSGCAVDSSSQILAPMVAQPAAPSNLMAPAAAGAVLSQDIQQQIASQVVAQHAQLSVQVEQQQQQLISSQHHQQHSIHQQQVVQQQQQQTAAAQIVAHAQQMAIQQQQLAAFANVAAVHHHQQQQSAAPSSSESVSQQLQHVLDGVAAAAAVAHQHQQNLTTVLSPPANTSASLASVAGGPLPTSLLPMPAQAAAAATILLQQQQHAVAALQPQQQTTQQQAMNALPTQPIGGIAGIQQNQQAVTQISSSNSFSSSPSIQNSPQTFQTKAQHHQQEMVSVPKDVLMKLVEQKIEAEQRELQTPTKCQCHCQCGRYPGDMLIVDKVMADLLENSSKQLNSDHNSSNNSTPRLSQQFHPAHFGCVSAANNAAMPSAVGGTSQAMIPEAMDTTAMNTTPTTSAAMDQLSNNDQEMLGELAKANELWKCSAPANGDLKFLRGEYTDGDLRRLIAVAKTVETFKRLDQHDQERLLKRCFESFFVLRSLLTVTVDEFNLSLLRQHGVPEATVNFYAQFPSEWRQNETVNLLLGMLLLFDVEVADLKCAISITVENMKFQSILKRLLFILCERDSARADAANVELLSRLDLLKQIFPGPAGSGTLSSAPCMVSLPMSAATAPLLLPPVPSTASVTNSENNGTIAQMVEIARTNVA